MKLGVAEILNRVSQYPSRQEKIQALREHRDNNVLTLMLKMSMDPGLKWLIPAGAPPYKPAPDFDQQGMLYKEARRLYLFLDVPNTPKMSQIKREKQFIDLLEALHPDDAKLLINVKDKKLLAKGITKKLVEEALPGLLQ